MTVLSPNHHARHLQTEEEKAEFFCTAPIETGAAYWDAADALHNPDPSGEEIDVTQGLVIEALYKRARHGGDAAIIHSAIRTIDRTTDQILDI